MNKKEFRKVTEILEENYSKKVDLRVLDIWYQEFEKYSKEQYESIVTEVIKSEMFMPNLAKMKEYSVPVWFDEKIEKKEASEEEKKKIEEMLKEFM